MYMYLHVYIYIYIIYITDKYRHNKYTQYKHIYNVNNNFYLYICTHFHVSKVTRVFVNEVSVGSKCNPKF